MVSKSKIRDAVGKSEIENWEKHPFTMHPVRSDDESMRACWVYEHDVNLRLERTEALAADVEQEWTAELPAPSHSYEYYLFYGTSPVESHVIVSVDEHNAAIPLPERDEDGNRYITPYQATLGRVVTGDYQDFEIYLDWTDIEIR
ncbi:hypothetical protein ZOD2009_20432 [Haladaptatus paucihalophilus DX253]|uniref:Uncharacterized protein n=1 Tax=Haladaptatus paucihalophilus DX253 TaxID=797209 RepID=E7QZ79_HALPU|nr:hypothetical protein [Haladaptatus paucihalophilus]EFW90000.1 hypothetical protein ZOD2009_20432 [Haladaptatus paucihalophilus DX253]SHL02227.1 hypothetical protein SAMN05444342_2766 [Haladaptatus paucihalophilus DX253]